MVYQIVLADPPWEYESPSCLALNSCISGEFQKPYPYMPIEEICALAIKNIAADNSLLFLWATSPRLNFAFKVIESWGFGYATIAFVWEKVKVNPGYYTLSSTELCLVGRRGNIPQPRARRNVRQFFQKERNKHSKKPEEIRNLITEMFPLQTKIEVFAREKTEGWDCWGNEVESDIIITPNKSVNYR